MTTDDLIELIIYAKGGDATVSLEAVRSALDQAREAGAASRQAEIVAWLRGPHDTFSSDPKSAPRQVGNLDYLFRLANAIEASAGKVGA